MSRRNILTAGILVLAIAAGLFLYLDYRSSPRVQAPSGPDNVATSTTQPQEGDIANDILRDWSAIAKIIPLTPSDSDRWSIDGIRTLGPGRAMVAFEDGLDGHVAIITKSGSTYKLDKLYQKKLTFTQAELDAIDKEFGSAGYAGKVYVRSEGDGHLVQSDRNVFLQAANTMIVKLALLNPDGSLPNEVKPGDISGCDHVVLMERSVPKTSAPLRAALDLLLRSGDWSDHQIASGKLYNYASRGTLAVESVNITNGTAKIYLVGQAPALNGVCDDPRLFVQMAQTARQFSSVQKVELYVNGKRNDGTSDLRG